VECAIVFPDSAVACCIHFAQSRAHNHCLLSALLNGPINQAGLRLVSVLCDQNYLAVSPAEQVAALIAFSSSTDDVGLPLAVSVVVIDDMCVALDTTPLPEWLRRKQGQSHSDLDGVGSIPTIPNARYVPSLLFHERFNEASLPVLLWLMTFLRALLILL
jgi:hypothetical protein